MYLFEVISIYLAPLKDKQLSAKLLQNNSITKPQMKVK